MPFKFVLTKKCYAGFVLIAASFLLGFISKVIILRYFYSPAWISMSIFIYLISWIMLVVGGVWVGKEYFEATQKYFTYQYYHESVKQQTSKALVKAKDVHEKVKGKLKRKTNKE